MKSKLLRYVSRFTVILLALILVGCGTTWKLKKFKEWHNSEKYEKIVTSQVDCKPTEQGCNQLYLIKGDTCYLLAKRNVHKLENFDCAIDNLQVGIEYTTQWKLDSLDLNEAQTYENLWESLRERQDMASGEVAPRYTNQLLESSCQYKKRHQNSLAAIYFCNGARFAKVQRKIVQSGSNPSICNEVKDIFDEVDEAAGSAVGTRYSASLRRLRSDVERVINSTCQ